MIKNILFDLDDTILDFKKAEKIALFKTLEELGVTPDDEIAQKYSRYNISQWKRLELGEITRQEVKVNRYKLLFDDIGADCSPELATEIYEEKLAVGHYFIDGAEDLLKSLCKSYNLYLVSNGSKKVQTGRLASAGISPYFKGIFISQDVGYEKPSPLFFEKVFHSIDNFSKSETAIIGDSLSSDIKGGINAGIKTVWFNPRKEINDSNIIPDYEISLLSLLKKLIQEI